MYGDSVKTRYEAEEFEEFEEVPAETAWDRVHEKAVLCARVRSRAEQLEDETLP